MGTAHARETLREGLALRLTIVHFLCGKLSYLIYILASYKSGASTVLQNGAGSCRDIAGFPVGEASRSCLVFWTLAAAPLLLCPPAPALSPSLLSNTSSFEIQHLLKISFIRWTLFLPLKALQCTVEREEVNCPTGGGGLDVLLAGEILSLIQGRGARLIYTLWPLPTSR